MADKKTPLEDAVDLANTAKLTLDTIVDDLRKIKNGVHREYEGAKGAQKFLLNTVEQEISRTLRKLELLQTD